MKETKTTSQIIRSAVTFVVCAALISPGSLLLAQTPSPTPAVKPTTAQPAKPEVVITSTLQPTPTVSPTPASSPEAKIPAEQLDALVAPIALYPDPLLSQTLVASTYPLELILLQQWLTKNKTLKDKELAEAVKKQPWDPSIQAMAALPDVVKWLTDDIQWTTDLGNAFLAQEDDVMASVQRMRAKAKEKGTLASNDKMKVETETVEDKEYIVIQQANPQTLYVPQYNPLYAYGPLGYPYPGIWYPPYYGGYYGGIVAAGMIGFGVGIAMGAFWGGGWGWGCGWGIGGIRINPLNNFVGRAGGIGGVGGVG